MDVPFFQPVYWNYYKEGNNHIVFVYVCRYEFRSPMQNIVSWPFMDFATEQAD